jgi:hypothetical protein
VGQIVLKHYRRGIVLLLVCSASLLAFVTEATRQATAIVDKMLSEGGNIDVKAIEKASGSESLPLHLLGWFMIGCWILGIVDAYRIGRKKDIEARGPKPKGSAMGWRSVMIPAAQASSIR